MAISGVCEHGWLTREADVGANPVLRVDLDDYVGYNEFQFTEAGASASLTIDASGNLFLAGKKHTRNYVTANVIPMPAARYMRVAFMVNTDPPSDYSAVVVGIGGGECAVHYV